MEDNKLLRRNSFLNYLYNVIVLHLMAETNSLWTVLDTSSLNISKVTANVIAQNTNITFKSFMLTVGRVLLYASDKQFLRYYTINTTDVHY